MISDMTTSKHKTRALPLGLMAFRTAKCIVQPLLILVALLSGALSLFEPMEGSNSREIARMIFASALVVITAFIVVDKLIARKNKAFAMYTPKVKTEYQPGSLLVLVLWCVIIFIPLYIVVITSIKTPQEANSVDFTWFPQKGITFDSYKELFLYGELTGIYMTRALLNSLLMATVPSLVSMLVSAASAFMFVQGKFRGKKELFRALIFKLLLPGCMTQAATITMYDAMGVMGTPVPLVIGCLFGNITTIMFLREYMTSLAKELFESAEIDGAGRINQYFNIVLPLVKPALTGQFILGFIGGFNDYMGPLIYIHQPQWYTVQIALDFLNTGNLGSQILTAGCVFTIVPMLITYMIFQKQILSSFTMSHGLKG